MKPLTLPQSLALTEFLARHFAGLRKNELNPAAADDMTAGERFAVKFGGRVAAWVSMPNPATRATVKNEALLLAWCRKNLPDAVEQVDRVRPETAKKLGEEMKARGGWISPDGELIPVDGIEVSTGDPSPRVELEDSAAEVIAAAWNAGEIDLGGMLALPAAGGDGNG